jgi:hypothetical protein
MTRQKKNQLLPRLNMQRHAKVAMRRLNLCRLLGTIRHDCAATFEAMRQADDLLNRTTQAARGIESQGYVYDLAKYGNRICAIVTPDSDNGDVARSNDEWQSVRVASMDKAQAEVSPLSLIHISEPTRPEE